ncbi:MAG: transcriptional regulator, partial [Enterobacterales bacterium]
MYLPNHFQLDETEVPNFISNHPFATLISINGDGLMVNYAPLLFDIENNCLIGHFANNNDHLKLMAANQPITVIFHGPDGYVSPNWYKDKTQVPTWNFAAVEIKGRASLLTSTNDKLQLLEELSSFHENRINSDWSMTKMPAEKLELMLSAITGFKIQIDSIKGKAKLSQNKSLA